MFENSQNWELFGYDVRHLGRYWTAAWRDLLWAHDSPVRARLDEVVKVRSGKTTTCYQAGAACAAPTDAVCTAVLLPEDLVLSKRVAVPLQAESELDALLELEVRGSSPFAADDTRWGWSVVTRDDNALSVALAIVSASAAMAYLGRAYESHDPHAQEVWASVDNAMIVLRGFGEDLRERRYRRRLLHAAGLLAVVAVLLLGMVAAAAAFKGAELQRLEQIAGATAKRATEATRLKELLAEANDTITAANDVVRRFPNPHAEVARLTRLLGDDASISSFSMTGPELRLRGRAGDAAKVMAQLTDTPGYAEVTAPQAITRIGDGEEQFYLNIRLAGEGAP